MHCQCHDSGGTASPNATFNKAPGNIVIQYFFAGIPKPAASGGAGHGISPRLKHGGSACEDRKSLQKPTPPAVAQSPGKVVKHSFENVLSHQFFKK
jgi:hypothetical protein